MRQGDSNRCVLWGRFVRFRKIGISKRLRLKIELLYRKVFGNVIIT